MFSSYTSAIIPPRPAESFYALFCPVLWEALRCLIRHHSAIIPPLISRCALKMLHEVWFYERSRWATLYLLCICQVDECDEGMHLRLREMEGKTLDLLHGRFHDCALKSRCSEPSVASWPSVSVAFVRIRRRTSRNERSSNAR